MADRVEFRRLQMEFLCAFRSVNRPKSIADIGYSGPRRDSHRVHSKVAP